jgi:hypothetical protein
LPFLDLDLFADLDLFLDLDNVKYIYIYMPIPKEMHCHRSTRTHWSLQMSIAKGLHPSYQIQTNIALK